MSLRKNDAKGHILHYALVFSLGLQAIAPAVTDTDRRHSVPLDRRAITLPEIVSRWENLLSSGKVIRQFGELKLKKETTAAIQLALGRARKCLTSRLSAAEQKYWTKFLTELYEEATIEMDVVRLRPPKSSEPMEASKACHPLKALETVLLAKPSEEVTLVSTNHSAALMLLMASVGANPEDPRLQRFTPEEREEILKELEIWNTADGLDPLRTSGANHAAVYAYASYHDSDEAIQKIIEIPEEFRLAPVVPAGPTPQIPVSGITKFAQQIAENAPIFYSTPIDQRAPTAKDHLKFGYAIGRAAYASYAAAQTGGASQAIPNMKVGIAWFKAGERYVDWQKKQSFYWDYAPPLDQRGMPYSSHFTESIPVPSQDMKLNILIERRTNDHFREMVPGLDHVLAGGMLKPPSRMPGINTHIPLRLNESDEEIGKWIRGYAEARAELKLNPATGQVDTDALAARVDENVQANNQAIKGVRSRGGHSAAEAFPTDKKKSSGAANSKEASPREQLMIRQAQLRLLHQVMGSVIESGEVDEATQAVLTILNAGIQIALLEGSIALMGVSAAAAGPLLALGVVGIVAGLAMSLVSIFAGGAPDERVIKHLQRLESKIQSLINQTANNHRELKGEIRHLQVYVEKQFDRMRALGEYQSTTILDSQRSIATDLKTVQNQISELSSAIPIWLQSLPDEEGERLRRVVQPSNRITVPLNPKEQEKSKVEFINLLDHEADGALIGARSALNAGTDPLATPPGQALGGGNRTALNGDQRANLHTAKSPFADAQGNQATYFGKYYLEKYGIATQPRLILPPNPYGFTVEKEELKNTGLSLPKFHKSSNRFFDALELGLKPGPNQEHFRSLWQEDNDRLRQKAIMDLNFDQWRLNRSIFPRDHTGRLSMEKIEPVYLELQRKAEDIEATLAAAKDRLRKLHPDFKNHSYHLERPLSEQPYDPATPIETFLPPGNEVVPCSAQRLKNSGGEEVDLRPLPLPGPKEAYLELIDEDIRKSLTILGGAVDWCYQTPRICNEQRKVEVQGDSFVVHTDGNYCIDIHLRWKKTPSSVPINFAKKVIHITPPSTPERLLTEEYKPLYERDEQKDLRQILTKEPPPHLGAEAKAPFEQARTAALLKEAERGKFIGLVHSGGMSKTPADELLTQLLPPRWAVDHGLLFREPGEVLSETELAAEAKQKKSVKTHFLVWATETLARSFDALAEELKKDGDAAVGNYGRALSHYSAARNDLVDIIIRGLGNANDPRLAQILTHIPTPERVHQLAMMSFDPLVNQIITRDGKPIPLSQMVAYEAGLVRRDLTDPYFESFDRTGGIFEQNARRFEDIYTQQKEIQGEAPTPRLAELIEDHSSVVNQASDPWERGLIAFQKALALDKNLDRTKKIDSLLTADSYFAHTMAVLGDEPFTPEGLKKAKERYTANVFRSRIPTPEKLRAIHELTEHFSKLEKNPEMLNHLEEARRKLKDPVLAKRAYLSDVVYYLSQQPQVGGNPRFLKAVMTEASNRYDEAVKAKVAPLSPAAFGDLADFWLGLESIWPPRVTKGTGGSDNAYRLHPETQRFTKSAIDRCLKGSNTVSTPWKACYIPSKLDADAMVQFVNYYKSPGHNTHFSELAETDPAKFKGTSPEAHFLFEAQGKLKAHFDTWMKNPGSLRQALTAELKKHAEDDEAYLRDVVSIIADIERNIFPKFLHHRHRLIGDRAHLAGESNGDIGKWAGRRNQGNLNRMAPDDYLAQTQNDSVDRTKVNEELKKNRTNYLVKIDEAWVSARELTDIIQRILKERDRSPERTRALAEDYKRRIEAVEREADLWARWGAAERAISDDFYHSERIGSKLGGPGFNMSYPSDPPKAPKAQ